MAVRDGSDREKRPVQRLLLVAFLITGTLLLAYNLKHCSASRGNAKLSELQQLAGTIPTFPNFKEVDSRSIVKFDLAGITKDYVSTADYDEVKSFYLKELTQRCRVFIEEENLKSLGTDVGIKVLRLQKGEFHFALQYWGARSPKAGRNYSINYGWRSAE